MIVVNRMKNLVDKRIGLIIVSVMIIFSACTTEKNTRMYRGWHNMNARYNGYFYSNEFLKESVKKVDKDLKDDFSKIIPLFTYTDNNSAKTYYGDFDKSIKKSSSVIVRHTIKEKKTKKEIPNACKWIDENYMLIGKAHFYKRDLFSALEAFEYVSKIYSNPEAKYGAMIWIVRTNNEIGSFTQSEGILDNLRTAKDFPKDRLFQRDYAAVCAEYYLKREDYSQAIKHLTKAIALTKNKQVKARFTFVLAQLYEKLGDNTKAAQYYAMVPGLHPKYDMVFNSQIKSATLFDVNSGNAKSIKKKLNKMLKDDKNIEYQDQIYFALAEIAYKEKQDTLCLNYLEKSIRASTNNSLQKGISYLKRADIYYEKMEYTRAQANYDSTLNFLTKDYPNFEAIEAKKKSLTQLVINLNVISVEDSLQVLARMPEDQRNKKIDELIKRIEEQEKKLEEEKQQLLLDQQLNNNNNSDPSILNTVNVQTPTTSKAWYFYNPQTVSYGVGEFAKKWGSRKLEDNWRRSNKEVIMVDPTEENNEEEGDTSAVANAGNNNAIKATKNKKERAYYLKNIPLTEDAMAKSNQKVADAYYNVGSIYKEQLLNNQKSVEAFEMLLKRYPENKYKLNTCYQLYRTYLAMNNQPLSDKYKNIILNDYPDSEIAIIIKNPESVQQANASRNQAANLYTTTYQLYADGKYAEALNNCTSAETQYPKNYLMPQFAYLKALCIGRLQSIDEFERALIQITVKYPKEPVKDKAFEMLDVIAKQKNPNTSNTTPIQDSVKAEKFKFSEEGEYYWVTIVTNGKGDINQFKTSLSDLNSQSFSLLNLSISSVFLDASHQLITVKPFNGKAKAMDYYNFMKNEKELYAVLTEGEYSSFIISAENYTVFYKDKNIEEYKSFFTQKFK